MKATSVLGVDAGNTRVKVAIIDSDRVTRVGHVDTHGCDGVALRELIAQVDPVSVEGCVVASVVRGMGDTVRSTVEERLGVPTRVLTADMPLGIELNVASPETVGIDRLVIASEAFAISGGEAIVVGAGTAITVDVVTGEGAYVGGTISPGLRMSAWALSERTSLLPEIQDFDQGTQPPGTTSESIKAGVLVGAAGAIDGLIRDLSERAALSDPSVILTGGDAEKLSPYVHSNHKVMPDLLMRGLGRIYTLQDQG